MVKVAQLKLKFAPLGLKSRVQQPSEAGAICEAKSNVGTFTMSVRRLPLIGQIEARITGYSTSQATVTLFRDGRVRWQVPAFDVTVSPPYCALGCWLNNFFSVGSLTEWVTAADLDFLPWMFHLR